MDNIVVAEIERFVMKRMDEGLLSSAATSAAPSVGREERSSSPALLQLAEQVRQGILPDEGFEAMLRALATDEVQPIISSMDLEELRRRAAQPQAAIAESGGGFERPDLDSDYVAPRNDIERTLAGFWTELLGVESVGVNDSFFDLGGHSLIAVRLFRMIKKAYAVDLPISVLFESSTIAECAALLSAQVSGPEAEASGEAAAETAARHVHLVSMSAGSSNAQTPFFVCAGMFGNILNLRQLALHIGKDRPVYGLQARGLYGDQEPHETFEEAARDYIAEIRTVQPHGPYLLGGFSGGGLIAYEIAQQFRAAGEEVSLLVMLDTPLPTQPPLGLLDRIDMKLQDLRRSGFSFFSDWLRERRKWQEEQQHKLDAASSEATGAHFHNMKIEAAFYGALKRYELKPYDGRVALYRPKLNIIYHLRGGRRLQEGRNVALDDNGWTPFVARLDVQEVPGDHDSMVLEPYVRVLSSRMRTALDDAAPKSTAARMAAE